MRGFFFFVAAFPTAMQYRFPRVSSALAAGGSARKPA